MTGPPFEEACVRCGAGEDLVEDENAPGLWLCRACLERVERQNRMIDEGWEDEPEVEP